MIMQERIKIRNMVLINITFKITKYDWRIYTKNRKENIKPQI